MIGCLLRWALGFGVLGVLLESPSVRGLAAGIGFAALLVWLEER